MMNDLVSIIMLCHNGGKYVEESIRSILAQTYQNWELLVVDDNSADDSISQVMGLKEEDARCYTATERYRHPYQGGRIKVSRFILEDGETLLRNSAIRDAQGRWIAFLDVGDVWEPTKLEHQIAFMEENKYAFSYTKYGIINKKSEGRGVVIGGKTHVTHKDMMKCCWPGYLTVMYDANKIGRIRVRNLKKNNDYALWLNVSEWADCYLLDECLAKMRTPWGLLGKLLLTNKLKWRYEVYHTEMKRNPLVASLMTLRNMCYGMVKWGGYVSRHKNNR